MDTVKNKLTKEELAWYAGFMDGEGTITIKRYNRAYLKADGQKRVYYIVMVSCAQVNKAPNNIIIKSFKEHFGGSVYEYAQSPKHSEKRIDTIQWSIASKSAVNFLNQIKPFLKIKKPNAEIALELIKGLNKGNKPTPISDEEMIRREKLFYKMRTNNVKGKLHLQRLNEENSEKSM